MSIRAEEFGGAGPPASSIMSIIGNAPLPLGDAPWAIDSRIYALKDTIDKCNLTLGRELYVTMQRKLYRDHGCNSIDEYVAKRMGGKQKTRQARKLRDIYKRFVLRLHLDPARISKEITLSNAYEILPVINEENKEAWLEKARTLSTEALRDEVRAAKSRERKVRDQLVEIMFRVHPDVAETWAVARSLIASDGTTERPETAFEHAVGGFIASEFAKRQSPAASLDFYRKLIERIFGVNLVPIGSDAAARYLIECVAARPDLFPEDPPAVPVEPEQVS